MKPTQFVAPFTNSWAVLGETLMLPLFVVGLGIWLNPLDPLWVNAAFPWAWFAPVILALRYGPFPGLAGAAVLLLAWIAFRLSGWVGGEFPKLNFLGGLILVMLSSEFSSLWLARARRAESMQGYLDQRLEYLTHQYYLLRLSHDRLEQDLISRPMAMREALSVLRELTVDGNDTSSLPGGDQLLRLFAQYCQLEAAALYAFRDGELSSAASAILGAAQADLDPDDPLVRHVLEEGTLAHIAQNLAASTNPSRYVIAAPLITTDGRQLGLLTVERLPFFAMHEETLQTLNLFLGYYTDGIEMQAVAAPIRSAFPACPFDFAFELQRLWRVREESGVKSVMVALDFRTQPEFDDLVLQIRRQKRSLDVNWLIEAEQRKVFVTLMPLASTAAAEGYLARIEDWTRQKTGLSLVDAGVFAHVLNVDSEPPITLLQRLLDTCHVSYEARTVCADA